MKSTPKLRKSATRKEWVKHWCPPRPLAGLEVLEKILNRHVQVACPESRLVVAVIVLAIQDCLDRSDSKQRQEARRFIMGSHLQYWCDLIGLHPDFVRAIARKAGYLASEERHWQRVSAKVPMLTKSEDNASKSPIPPIICH
ncbi:hypothetical protein [Nitrosomonas communis]|uniref:Uncharacterized protein n=1 Tax=Nitrosomonas communis TaxID=44574 RepID=A0A1I4NDH9_9PROT|nr:hypothetical protein [Nitrosomonas communis]SFM13519.1 hypothetical protein SAMN05421863_101458 [Nitrosomonas communis]